MYCEQVQHELGRYVDDELSATERLRVENHVATCDACRSELQSLQELAGGLAWTGPVAVPDGLWNDIEQRLHKARSGRHVALGPSSELGGTAHGHGSTAGRYGQRVARWAIAAAILLAAGLGLFGVTLPDSSARASNVDFSILLDALSLDAHKAFRRFLIRYEGRQVTPVEAKRVAAHLNFDTPTVLPGGFQLQTVYRLRFGDHVGVAAAYDRDGEFLAAVFHPPVRHEGFGSHKDLPCLIGEHCGHKVQVGAWKLVHLTDPTTCHCVLSRLDETTELPAVMAAVAPAKLGGLEWGP